jgi:uncharacterized membrane protein YcjF (UPF0283 family)
MSEKEPFDWTELQQRWQSEEVPAEVKAEARRHVERDRRRLLLELVFTGIVVLSVGAWSVRVLITDPQPGTIVGMLVFWSFAGILIGAGILNQRGIWAPAEESTRSYLRLSLERALRREELSRFGLWLMAFWFVAAAGMLTWSAVEAYQSGRDLLPMLLEGAAILGLTFGVLGVFTEWSRRRARRRAAELQDTLRALDQEGADGGSTVEGASYGAPP